MLPVVTVIGLEFAFLLGGLVVTEQVFNLNGLGLLFVEAIARRDYTLTQALVLLVASAFIFVNFLMDVMYAWLDPRIRHARLLPWPSPLLQTRSTWPPRPASPQRPGRRRARLLPAPAARRHRRRRRAC